METTTLFYRFGVALVCGILVGLQREHSDSQSDSEMFAGVRTFALIAIIGCTAAFIADILATPGIFIGITLLLGAQITVAYFVRAWRGSIGMTTDVAALLTMLIGALCYWAYIPLAVAIVVTLTALLSLKFEMQRLVNYITREDIYATLKFAIITAIVLPILPNQSYLPVPFDVLNPYRIWLMVVFISGISFLGYLLVKIVGTRRGIGLTGLLGGLASSTAVTLSFSQRSRTIRGFSKPFAMAIMIAWTTMFFRIAVEVIVLNLPLLDVLWLPISAMALVGLGYCAYLYFAQKSTQQEDVELTNPFELGPAFQFGLLYAAVLVISRVAQTYSGDTAIYVSSIIAGLTDVDAITLSMAELSQFDTITQLPRDVDLNTAARAIILAAMSNTIVKGGIVLLSGGAGLRRAFLPGFVLVLIAGAGGAFLI